MSLWPKILKITKNGKNGLVKNHVQGTGFDLSISNGSQLSGNFSRCTLNHGLKFEAIAIISLTERINSSDHNCGDQGSPKMLIYGYAIFCKYLEIRERLMAQIWMRCHVWD